MGSSKKSGFRAASLFSGIGGFDRGFENSGIKTEMLCEIDPSARLVLSRSFKGASLCEDIREVRSLPDVDVVSAGFPCQNLSLAGSNAGISGKESSLVGELFRLLRRPNKKLKWVVLENVPFMLWHKKGEAIRVITQQFEELGFRWAYRVVDARCFGIPQRRRRVLLVASKTDDPGTVLFSDNDSFTEPVDDDSVPCGFSWTEGKGGLGWAVNSIPTLKAGSTVGIPSPPAIWMRTQGRIVTPHISDAERLQGFPSDWTNIDQNGVPIKEGVRWRLVGNAVCVPVANWLGKQLLEPKPYSKKLLSTRTDRVWPNAACSGEGKILKADVSQYPVAEKMIGLSEFLECPGKPLSIRASTGFLKRARSGPLRFTPGFLDAVELHISKLSKQMEEVKAVA